MKDARIVLVAEWDGWCGACTAERPLVLTRTGRRSVRAWLSARSAPDELLTLTCRLCGVGSVVPAEADDPEVVLTEDESRPVPAEPSAGLPLAAPLTVGESAPGARGSAEERAPEAVGGPASSGTDLHGAREAVGAGLRALLAQRTAATEAAPVPLPAAAELAPVPLAAVPVVAPLFASLPSQRSSAESAAPDGFAALQLLAEGIDLVSPSQT